jgi:hypothetical protein
MAQRSEKCLKTEDSVFVRRFLAALPTTGRYVTSTFGVVY